MSAERVRPPHTDDERTQLGGWLNLQRRLVPWKCDGLSVTDAHSPVIPTSPHMTVAGLVSHLRWTEHLWFEVIFLGSSPLPNPQLCDGADDADMRVDGTPLPDLLAAYRTQWERSNVITAAHSLDTLAQPHPDLEAPTATLRWILVHMLEETARHIGHLDILRELLDGTKGYY